MCRQFLDDFWMIFGHSFFIGVWSTSWNNKYKNRFNKTLFNKPTDEDKPTDKKTKFAFGILNGRVWKSKLMSKMNFSSKNPDELDKIIECDDDDKETYKYLNLYSFDIYMDTVSTLFQKAITNGVISISKKESIESTVNLIKWDIHVVDGKIILAVLNKHNTEWNLIDRRIENYHYPYKYYDEIENSHKLIASSLFNNNDIVILTTFGILIYTFSENNKSISLNYFYFIDLTHKREKVKF